MKFVCYKEFDDPAEPVFPGLIHKGKTLPLARVVAVAEAFHPRGVSVPDDLNALVSLLPTFAAVLKDLEKSKVLDQIWQEVGVVAAAPLPRPNRILGVGLNFVDHAEEVGLEMSDRPVLFLKPSTAVIATGESIVLPKGVGKVEHEGELAVVIGKIGRNVPAEEALGLVAGYTLCNDVTARDQQKRDIAHRLPWFLSKGYDTFAPLGPCLVTADEIRNPDDLTITVTVNGEVRQQINTSRMVTGVAQIISYLSKLFILYPGDVIMTGSPPGTGTLVAGDIVEVSVPEIGTLTNPVVDEEE